MNKLNLAQARSLMRLRNTPEFDRIREWLEQSLADTDKALRRSDGNTLLRAQGQAMTLETLLDKIEHAQTIAEKMAKHTG